MLKFNLAAQSGEVAAGLLFFKKEVLTLYDGFSIMLDVGFLISDAGDLS